MTEKERLSCTPWVFDPVGDATLKTEDGTAICFTGDIGGFVEDEFGLLAACAPEMMLLLEELRFAQLAHKGEHSPELDRMVYVGLQRKVEAVLKKARRL